MIGISMFYRREDLTAEEINSGSLIKVTGDSMFIQKTKPFYDTRIPIYTSALYEYDDKSIGLALVKNITTDIFTSRIILSKLNLTLSSLIPQTITRKELSASMLNLQSIKISDITYYGSGRFVILAIVNYGIVVYSINLDKIVQSVNLIPSMSYHMFTVQHIVIENLNNIHLVMDRFGLISLKI